MKRGKKVSVGLGVPATLILMLLATVPVDLGAQTAGGQEGQEEGRATGTGDPGIGAAPLTLHLALGLLTPLSDLTPAASGGASDEVNPAPQLSPGVGVAVGATLFFSPKIGLGARVSWSNTDVDVQEVAGGGSAGERLLGEADYVTASLEFIYRLLVGPLGGLLDPYVAAGAGVRHVSFSFDDPLLVDGTDPMGTLAAGIRTSLGRRFHWTLEVRDHISVFEAVDAEGRLQNDLMVTVGFGVGL